MEVPARLRFLAETVTAEARQLRTTDARLLEHVMKSERVTALSAAHAAVPLLDATTTAMTRRIGCC